MEFVFDGRSALSDEDFFIQYFSNFGVPKEIPIRVRNLLSEMLDLDLSRISSEDSFQNELVFMWDIDSMLEFELPIAIENEFDFVLSDEEILKITNIQDIVMIVHNKLSMSEETFNNESS